MPDSLGSGLTKSEVREAFKKLLTLGPGSQHSFYSTWFELSQAQMTAQDREALDIVEKIDSSNEQQGLLLYKYYHFNFEVVNFWLNSCIFPTETMQYPRKLIANAWHLADNRKGFTNGFSGTDDNHRALPLQVRQESLHINPYKFTPLHAHTHTHIHAYTHTHTNTLTHRHAYAHAHINKHMHTRVPAYTNTLT